MPLIHRLLSSSVHCQCHGHIHRISLESGLLVYRPTLLPRPYSCLDRPFLSMGPRNYHSNAGKGTEKVVIHGMLSVATECNPLPKRRDGDSLRYSQDRQDPPDFTALDRLRCSAMYDQHKTLDSALPFLTLMEGRTLPSPWAQHPHRGCDRRSYRAHPYKYAEADTDILSIHFSKPTTPSNRRLLYSPSNVLP